MKPYDKTTTGPYTIKPNSCIRELKPLIIKK
jgi:hypothetical protein